MGPPAIHELSTHELRESNENSSVVRIAIEERVTARRPGFCVGRKLPGLPHMLFLFVAGQVLDQEALLSKACSQLMRLILDVYKACRN